MRKGIYFDTANPHHAVRLIEGGDGRKDLLLVSGEEHDQGIKPEEYADYFGRCNPSFICLYPDLGQVLCMSDVACLVISSDCFAQVAIMQLLPACLPGVGHTAQRKQVHRSPAAIHLAFIQPSGCLD